MQLRCERWDILGEAPKDRQTASRLSTNMRPGQLSMQSRAQLQPGGAAVLSKLQVPFTKLTPPGSRDPWRRAGSAHACKVKGA